MSQQIVQSLPSQLQARRGSLVGCSGHVKSHIPQPQQGHAGSSSSLQHAAAAGPQIHKSSTSCSAASVAGLRAAGDDSFLQPYSNQPLQQQQLHQGQQLAAGASSRKLLTCVRTAQSYSQLLNFLQDCSRDEISADLLKAVLLKASQLTRSAAAAAKAGSKSSTNSSSSSRDALSAQQLVCACLQLLLEVNEQISGWHLANCLLSLGVLCGRGGPASPVMAGAAAAVADHASAASGSASTFQHQQEQQQVSGVLQQLLLNPARSSRRDLEALLQATGPQHQLQQLLHLTRRTAVASAQPQQLVDMLYGLAVLRVRPAPDVLGLMLHGLQEQLQDMQDMQSASPTAGGFSAGYDGSISSSGGVRMQSAAAAAAAAAGGVWTPKLLSQLLWCAATLQLHLPRPWLESYWDASWTALPLYGAQDVANTCWALAALCQQQQQQQQPASLSSSSSSLAQPPWQLPSTFQAALLQQIAAAAPSMTGQGVSNTLWGLAVLRVPTEPQTLLALLQRAVRQGGKLQPQEFANTIWGAARCLQLAEQQQSAGLAAAGEGTAAAAAAAATGCKQLLQQLLQQFGPQLSPKLQPRDWSNIIWGAGFAQVRPDKTLLQALWRKTPAGFSTSLNPHYALAGSIGRPGPNSNSGVQAALLNPTVWSPQALSNTLWGCARLRVKPPKVWLQGFEAASVAVLAWFSDQQLANTLWALGELRQVPSDAWLHMFWQQAGGMAGKLLETAAAAAAAAGDLSQQQSYEQQQQWGDEGEWVQGFMGVQRELLQQQGHVVQLLQACGRLGLQPPVLWLQEAVRGLCMAASALLSQPGILYDQQQQQRSHGDGDIVDRVLLTYAAAVLHLSELAHGVAQQQRRGSSSSSSSSRGDLTIGVSVAAGQQLLQILCAAAGPQHHQQQQQGVQLPAEAALMLLLCLPKLQLPTATANAVGAALLWTVHHQQQKLSGSQMAQLAFAVAELAWIGGEGLWLQQQQQLLEAKSAPQPGAVTNSSSSRSDLLATAFTDQLAASLTQHTSSMSAVDLRFSIAAVAKLQRCAQRIADTNTAAGRTSTGSNSSSSSSPRSSMQRLRHHQQQVASHSRPSAAVTAFAAGAGAAVGGWLGSMTPHQRAVVAAGLAQLGYSPGVQWVEALLHYSSCDLSGCRNGDLVRLVRGLPMLLGNMQRQQQQQQRLSQQRQVLQQQNILQQQQQQLQRAVLLQQQQASTGKLSAAQQLLRPPKPQLQQFALQNQQRQSSSSSGSSFSSRPRVVSGLDQQLLREWLVDWLSESEVRLPHFSGTELMAVAQGLARLAPWLRSNPAGAMYSGSAVNGRGLNHSSRQQQQQQQQQQQLRDSWQQSFLAAAAARLPELSTPELLMLLAAVRRLGLTAGPDWCSTVVATVAARAAAAAGGDAEAVTQLDGVTECDMGGVDSGALRVHHIGWLALHLKGLGYTPTPQQQEQLLQFVAAACDLTPAAAAAAAAVSLDSRGGSRVVAQARPVPARQLWQLLVLLAQAGWVVDEAWVQRVQGSAAGVRMRAWLGQRRHLGTWRGLWAMFDR